MRIALQKRAKILLWVGRELIVVAVEKRSDLWRMEIAKKRIRVGDGKVGGNAG